MSVGYAKQISLRFKVIQKTPEKHVHQIFGFDSHCKTEYCNSEDFISHYPGYFRRYLRICPQKGIPGGIGQMREDEVGKKKKNLMDGPFMKIL